MMNKSVCKKKKIILSFLRISPEQLVDIFCRYGTSAFALKNLLNGVLDSFNTEQDLQQVKTKQLSLNSLKL